MEQKFELIFKPYRHNQTFKMQVELIHQSEELMRFKLSGGERYIIMEKLLNKKKGNWRIVKSNVNFSATATKQSAYTIFELQDKLDEYLDTHD